MRGKIAQIHTYRCLEVRSIRDSCPAPPPVFENSDVIYCFGANYPKAFASVLGTVLASSHCLGPPVNKAKVYYRGVADVARNKSSSFDADSNITSPDLFSDEQQPILQPSTHEEPTLFAQRHNESTSSPPEPRREFAAHAASSEPVNS